MKVLYRLSVTAFILQLFLAATTYAIEADWLAPVSGTWNDRN